MTGRTRGVTDRSWEPVPQPGDGPDGRGEAGEADELETRRETEEAAETGRFHEGDELRDASNPIEPEAPARGFGAGGRNRARPAQRGY